MHGNQQLLEFGHVHQQKQLHVGGGVTSSTGGIVSELQVVDRVVYGVVICVVYGVVV